MKHRFRIFRPLTSALAWGGSGVLLLVAIGALHGAELPSPLTLDLPIPANKALPTWLGTPDSPATNFATLNLPILTPAPAASLLVTVYFKEKQGGFLRIIWNGTQGAQLLSDNFYENIGMANQRSLLVSPEMLQGDGTLSFQCGDSVLGIARIKLEWLVGTTGLGSPEVQDVLVTPSVGATQASVNLNGQPNPTAPGAWQDQLVTVPLTDTPVRIEEGVDFSIDLDKVPGSARIALEETGLPLGQRLIVWINEQRAGTITPAVPDLLDDGFLAEGSATTNYVGWRNGSFFAPVALLKAGVNTVQFSTEDDSPTTKAAPPNAPLAIKALVMQLNYTPAPALTPVLVDAPTFLPPKLSLSPASPDLRPESDSTPPETPTP